MPTNNKPNRLIAEKSPYLLQHAHNPVNWFPWGDEAFEKAKRENKPVLVLDPTSNLKVKKFSLGMKQRLNIAQAIFEKPDILLLDEPTNAIDEKGVELVHKILLEEKARGATIIIASHHKEDIVSLCDCTLKMNEGVLEALNNE
ncbi:DUF255 domain-containing protein [Bacillus sp. C28GYM-DRY-1]|nr:DUF255 domain-containing protein [Bacillus sp. C28GYM-DRY-1]MDO3660983.1 DUF255 domain-containing protein [Bacillus sp. C28GYM-DRY-1]